MRIEKLDIKGFGKFQNEVFTPGRGMNVIYGFNEAGKTTLQSFIKGMLFGLKGGKRGKDGAFTQARQYNPWNGKSYGGILEYALDDGRRFTIGRNFEKNTVYIQDEHSNNITAEFPAGREQGACFAEQHLGLSESSFERTAFIGQLQTPVDAEGRKILAEKLLNLRESADEGISLRRAVKTLKEAQLSQLGSSRTSIRPLNLMDARLAEAVSREKELTRLHESRMEYFLQLDRLKEENSLLNVRLEQAVTEKEALLAGIKAVQQRELHHKLEQYRSELAEVTRERQKHEAAAAELQMELDELDGYKNFSHQDLHVLSADYTRFLLLEKELEELWIRKAENEEKLADAKAILHQYALFDREKAAIDIDLQQLLQEKSPDTAAEVNRLPRRHGWSIMTALLAAGIIMTDIFLFRTALPSSINMAVISVGTVLLFVSLVIFIKGAGRKKQNGFESYLPKNMTGVRERLLQWMQAAGADDLKEFTSLKVLYENNRNIADELEKDRVLVERREAWIKNQLEEIREQVTALLDRADHQGISGNLTTERVDAWKENFEACHALLPTLKEALDAADACAYRNKGLFREASLIYGRNIACIQDLEEALRETKPEPEKLPSTAMPYISPEELNHKIDNIREALAQNQLEMNTLVTRLENIPDNEELQQIHEKVEALQMEKERMIFLGKAADTAAQVLTEAGLAIRRDYVPALNREMSNILCTITGDKYSVLKADDSLTLKLQPGETTEEVLPEQLSSGTTDQIYLALRLAAVRIVEKKGERLPLFLDEPFAQYDEARTKNALTLLAGESATRQILLFTCKKREVELAKEFFKDTPLCIINLNRTEPL